MLGPGRVFGVGGIKKDVPLLGRRRLHTGREEDALTVWGREELW
jgi:hypothetical protein